MTAPTDVTAVLIDGAGCFLVRNETGVLRVLQLLLPSGGMVCVALDSQETASAIVKAVTDLQLAELESGETMRDLGLYREG